MSLLVFVTCSSPKPYVLKLEKSSFILNEDPGHVTPCDSLNSWFSLPVSHNQRTVESPCYSIKVFWMYFPRLSLKVSWIFDKMFNKLNDKNEFSIFFKVFHVCAYTWSWRHSYFLMQSGHFSIILRQSTPLWHWGSCLKIILHPSSMRSSLLH